MRWIFSIFIFSQILNLLSVFAEKVEKDSYELNSIKWEKLQENNLNKLDKIIWRSYQDDESYFKENIENNSTLNDSKILRDKSVVESQRRFASTKTEIEPFLPLNSFLDYGHFKISVRWKSSFDGGASGGTGQQNPSFIFDYGISDSSLLSIYFSEADDNLYNLIDGQTSGYHWQNYAISFKKNLLGGSKSIIGLSMVSTLEYWRHSSGSEKSKSIYNQNLSTFSKDRFDNIVGAISLPFSTNLNEKLNFFIVPGITFLPKELGTKENTYGNNFYLGSGFILDISDDIDMYFSYTIPFGPGNNYFDSEVNFNRKSLYSFGFGWDINPKIGIEGKITNSYGSSPSTGLLTIPSDNKLLYSANIIYRPSEEDTFLKPLNASDKLLSHGGVINSNALIPKSGTSQINVNFDSKGNWFGFYGYSLSNIFQLEVVNIGSFEDINLVNDKNKSLFNTYLNKNNLNYRVGGKILIFSPQKDDLFWLTLRTSLGRNNDTNQGYLFSELINTFRFNDWLAFNISPKYIFSGVESFSALGVSSYINLINNLMFIPEINASFISESDPNFSLALRYSFHQGKSFDLYYSNAAGTQDIGQVFEDKNHRFGINLNFLY